MTKSDLQIEHQLNSTNDHVNKPFDSKELAFIIADAADDRKGEDIKILDVSQLSYLADYFIVITGFSVPQLRAISLSIEGKVSDKLGIEPVRVEGKSEGNWILHDYGDVIAHIFLPEAREYYGLEAFWGRATTIDNQEWMNK
ncbi:ribosome silencing factor [Cyanobacterium stanieri LEGE 03274]|uniref:Ribosomal silencing factor RsfS n=1 Tax=Cyanobacterium stanieri LEGE 03274 TaxID=1828756 RepID=A0ABR9V419_9CHRO|nr:ribosome silencing factor [Cyanobacterium stanieri]MBE9222643.1 ribosome silencing factor [Cyanobacterium stanieri LEGE 03274]